MNKHDLSDGVISEWIDVTWHFVEKVTVQQRYVDKLREALREKVIGYGTTSDIRHCKQCDGIWASISENETGHAPDCLAAPPANGDVG